MLTNKDRTLTISTGEELLSYIKENSADDFINEFENNVSKTKPGRKPKTVSAEYLKKLDAITNENMTIKEIEDRFSVAQATAYRMRQEARRKNLDDTITKKAEEILSASDLRKPRSFSLSDNTYNCLISKKELSNFEGSLSDYLSYLIENYKDEK